MVRAPTADRRGRRTDTLVLVGAAQHEVGVRAADRRAVLEQHDERFLRVLSALLEAVGNRGETDLVAPHALVDALADDGSDEVERGSGHQRFLRKRGRGLIRAYSRHGRERLRRLVKGCMAYALRGVRSVFGHLRIRRSGTCRRVPTRLAPAGAAEGTPSGTS